MKLKKLTAGALAAAMCVIPVSAADTTEYTAGGGSTIETDFGLYSPTLSVTVPTKASIKVNPMFIPTATDSTKYKVASKDIVIQNKSLDTDKNTSATVAQAAGIPITVKANAVITKKGSAVKAHYNTFTASQTSTEKEIFMELLNGSANVTDGTDYLNTATIDYTGAGNTARATVTTYGSSIQFPVAAPTTKETSSTDFTPILDTSAADQVGASYAAFAIAGEATTNADWVADDINVTLTYNIKAANLAAITSALTTTNASATSITAASGNDLTIDLKTGSSGILGDAKVSVVVLHSPDGAYEDLKFMENDETPKFTLTGDDPINPTKYTLKFAKDGALAGILADKFPNKPQDLLIGLSDGRIIATTITVTKS